MTSFFDYPGDDTPTTTQDDFAFLADATDADWAAIRAHAELRHFQAGETVMADGDVDQSLYVVVDGELEAVVSEGRKGRNRRVNTMQPGMVIGEIGFFDGRPRSAAVRAVTEAKLLRLTKDAFDVLAAKEPHLGRAILFDLGRTLAARIRDVEAMR